MKTNNDYELREEILNNSNLYTHYSVRDKNGHFTEVVDVDSVIDYIKNKLNGSTRK